MVTIKKRRDKWVVCNGSSYLSFTPEQLQQLLQLIVEQESLEAE